MSYPKSVLNFYEKIKQLKFELNDDNEDGRIGSSILEKKVLNKIKEEIPQIIKAKSRCWYDFEYKGYYFNLKITNGKTRDNIFDRCSFLYILEGKQKNISFSKLYDLLTNTKNLKRNYREYYYLVIFKNGAKPFLRSLCDLKCVRYNSNLNNVLQISWNEEKKTKLEYRTIKEFKQYYFSLISKCINRFLHNLGGFAKSNLISDNLSI